MSHMEARVSMLIGLVLFTAGSALLIEEFELSGALSIEQSQRGAPPSNVRSEETGIAIGDVRQSWSGRPELLNKAMALEEARRTLPSPADTSTAALQAALNRVKVSNSSVARIRPMPGRNWCQLAAAEARIKQLSELTKQSLELCSQSVPGDKASLDNLWELTLIAWPVLPQSIRERLKSSLAFVAIAGRDEGRGHAERLAAIAARVAPERAELIEQGLSANPDLVIFFNSAFAMHKLEINPN